MTEYLGIIGSLLFAVCAWPLAWQAWKTKSAQGVEWSFLLLWFFGAFFSSIYALTMQRYALLPNFLSGGLGVGVVIGIKLFETFGKKRV